MSEELKERLLEDLKALLQSCPYPEKNDLEGTRDFDVPDISGDLSPESAVENLRRLTQG